MTTMSTLSLSPSPVHLAFSEIEWNSPIAVSNPEESMLRSAEENPLEYTLAEFDDAFLYTRLLLKVLDQVTGPSNPGCVSQLPLEQVPFSMEEARQYYEDDKTGVVTHYIITKLHEMIGLLLEQEQQEQQQQQQQQNYYHRQRPTSKNTAPKVSITTLFYHPDNIINNNNNNAIDGGKLLDDWRPLLRLLYRGGTGDAYSQRGAALCLAQILKAGSLASKCGVEETLQSLVSWLTSRLQSSHSVSLGVVTPTLVVLATCPPARLIFDQSGGIGYLTRHLRQFQHQRRGRERQQQQQQQQQQHRRGTGTTTTTTSSTSLATILSQPLSPSGLSNNHLHTPRGSSSNNNNKGTVRRRNSQKLNGFSNMSSSLSSISSSAHLTTTTTTTTSAMNIIIAVQQLYELCFCLWTMTYDCATQPTIRQHFHRDGAVSALGGLLTAAPREKVIRLALSSLRNLAQIQNNDGNHNNNHNNGNSNSKSNNGKSNDGDDDKVSTTTTTTTFVQEMIACGVQKSIQLLRERQWTDPDILEDLEVLHRILQENYKELSRWEVYLAELQSGRLEWGILHTERFFRENARRMEGRNMDFAPLKKLIQLLRDNSNNCNNGIVVVVEDGGSHEDDGDDDETNILLAVACFDLGEFVRHYPNGKAIVNRLGGKTLVMPLMEHPNQEVQRQALQCISKMLVQNWRAIGSV